jgi:hypothetical protein
MAAYSTARISGIIVSGDITARDDKNLFAVTEHLEVWAMTRIARRFAILRAEGRAGLVIYLTAGDPDPETSLALFRGLAVAGADLIEIGVPFSDPMADGPAIQAGGQRALKRGMTLRKTLSMAVWRYPA